MSVHAQSKRAEPTTLDAALDMLADLRVSAKASADALDRASRGRDLSDKVDDLIDVRRAIKSGRTDDALYYLERALSHLDSAWMCRA